MTVPVLMKRIAGSSSRPRARTLFNPVNRSLSLIAAFFYANSAGRIKAGSSGTVELIRGLTG